LAMTMSRRGSAVCAAGNRKAGMIPALHVYLVTHYAIADISRSV
jgi:hypothetical protein